MPRGDKSTYTDKQKRQAQHIEEGYEQRGVSEGEAERRAWATVNKISGGGKKSGSGKGTNKAPTRIRWPLGRRPVGRSPSGSAVRLRQKGGSDAREEGQIARRPSCRPEIQTPHGGGCIVRRQSTAIGLARRVEERDNRVLSGSCQYLSRL